MCTPVQSSRSPCRTQGQLPSAPHAVTNLPLDVRPRIDDPAVNVHRQTWHELPLALGFPGDELLDHPLDQVRIGTTRRGAALERGLDGVRLRSRGDDDVELVPLPVINVVHVFRRWLVFLATALRDHFG